MTKFDHQAFQTIKNRLHVAVVCDILDSLNYRNQGMHQRVRPLLPDPKNCGFWGRARTLLWEETDCIVDEDPYGLELEAMDSLQPGDVPVHSTSYSGTNTPWGELMSTVARQRGAVGCVCDANVRDCVQIIEMGFPVFCAGIRPLDSMGRGRVQSFDVPVHCGEVEVHSGEIVFADFDGVVVIPKAVEDQVLELALKKIEKENLTRKDLQHGKSLRETYLKYGVL